jgi:hypothetical protein
VSRSLLQEEQKWSLMLEMKPTRPAKPGTCQTLLTALGSGLDTGDREGWRERMVDSMLLYDTKRSCFLAARRDRQQHTHSQQRC